MSVLEISCATFATTISRHSVFGQRERRVLPVFVTWTLNFWVAENTDPERKQRNNYGRLDIEDQCYMS